MANHYLFGTKAILDAFRNGQPVECLYTAGQTINLELAKYAGDIPIIPKPKAFFQQFASVNHQFLVAQTPKVQLISLEKIMQLLEKTERGIVLILDSINDVRNFGAILRTAAAYDCLAVFFKEHHQAPINDLVLKTSMGGATLLNLCQTNNLSNLITKLQKIGFWIYATVLDAKAISLYQEKFPAKTALIVGNEGDGVKRNLINLADQTIFVPMGKKIQSLNVSVATGICLSYLFEKLKM